MATRVAASGGGNWTAGATWVGGVAPTAADDVQLTATSGNVTIDSGSVARSLDCTGYTGTLTHNAVNLTLGDATAGAGNIALKLVAGMTYTPAAGSGFRFQSSSTTQQTIDSGGKTLQSIEVFGSSDNASYLLAAALTILATSTLNFARGIFNTGNQAVSLGLFAITGTSAKTLTLGSSAITITGNSTTAVNVTGSNITVTANTAVFTLNGAQSGMFGILDWNGASAVVTATVTTSATFGGPTLNNLTVTGPATKTGLLIFNSATSVTGTLTVNGNSTVNRIPVVSDTTGTVRTVTAAAVSLSNVDFRDITAAGASIPWTGTSMGNALGNSNITFDAPVTQTRTGAGGNWSDLARWTSRVPLPQDNVIIGAAASGTVSMDMPRLGADLDCTGFAGTLSTAGIGITNYGGIVLGAGMTLAGTSTWTLSARSAKTITSNGKAFTQAISISAPSGTYTLTDALSTTGVNVFIGTFISAGLPISAGAWFISGTATTVVDVSNSTLTITGTTASVLWNVVNAATVVTATGSTIIFSNATANARTFGGNGKTYGTLTYTVAGSTGSLTITGSNTFNTINFSDVTNARSLLLTAGTTTTVTNLNVNGTPGKLMSIESTVAGTPATISKTSGIAYGDYLSIKDITATGGAVFNAAGSTNVSGNTGWTFTKLAVAAGGNWTSGATWSDGVVPTAASNVRLGASSGPVTIDTGAVARNLDCTGYVGTLTHNASADLTIGDATAGAGSIALKLVAGMTYTRINANTSRFVLVSTSATQQTIDTGGKSLGDFVVNGTGSSYLLSASFTNSATSFFSLRAGTFNTGNLACSWGLVDISTSGVKTLTLGSSAITITGNAGNTVSYIGSSLTVTANTSVMTLAPAATASSGFGGTLNWNGMSVVINPNVVDARIAQHTFNNLTYIGGATKTPMMRVYGTITMTGTLTITGNSAVNRILFSSDIAGTARTVTAAAVSFTNVDFMDITAAGAALPWTGTSMGNALGNGNITFDPSVTQTRNGAGGNWSDVARWTSRVPLPQDDVIINSGSSGTITADMPRLGATVWVSGGFGGTLAFSSVANTLYGSIELGAAMTVSGTQALTLAARSAKTITSNGKVFTQGVNVTAPGGTYTLVDTFITTNGTGLNGLAGTLDLAGQTVTTTNLNFVSGATGTFGASTINLTGTTAPTQLVGIVSGANISAASATLVIANATSTARTLVLGGKTYGTLTYVVAGSTGSLSISGSNTFNTINFSDASNARSLLFTAGTTTTVTNWNVRGGPGRLVILDTATGTSTFTLSKASSMVALADYLDIRRSVATGGATWYAGANSIDGGNNTGWQFTAAPGINSTADLTIPAMQAEASGSPAIAASGELSLPSLQAFAYGTVVASGTAVLYLSTPQVDAQSTVLATVNANLTLPALLLAATGQVPATGVSTLVLPAIQGSAAATITSPLPPYSWFTAVPGPVEVEYSAGQVEANQGRRSY